MGKKYKYYKVRQGVQKVLLNSLYGVLGLPMFRFYDLDNAGINSTMRLKPGNKGPSPLSLDEREAAFIECNQADVGKFSLDTLMKETY